MINTILLFLILGIVCYISLMVWAIGEHIAEETQKKKKGNKNG